MVDRVGMSDFRIDLPGSNPNPTGKCFRHRRIVRLCDRGLNFDRVNGRNRGGRRRAVGFVGGERQRRDVLGKQFRPAATAIVEVDLIRRTVAGPGVRRPARRSHGQTSNGVGGCGDGGYGRRRAKVADHVTQARLQLFNFRVIVLMRLPRRIRRSHHDRRYTDHCRQQRRRDNQLEHRKCSASSPGRSC